MNTMIVNEMALDDLEKKEEQDVEDEKHRQYMIAHPKQMVEQTV